MTAFGLLEEASKYPAPTSAALTALGAAVFQTFALDWRGGAVVHWRSGECADPRVIHRPGLPSRIDRSSTVASWLMTPGRRLVPSRSRSIETATGEDGESILLFWLPTGLCDAVLFAASTLGPGAGPDELERMLWRRVAQHVAAGWRVEDSARRGVSPWRGDVELDLVRHLLLGRWSASVAPTGDQVVAVRRDREARFTRRQQEIALRASLGWSNKEIAYGLGVADNTVSAHLHRALAKMGLPSRLMWIRLASQAAASAGLGVGSLAPEPTDRATGSPQRRARFGSGIRRAVKAPLATTGR